MLGDPGTAKSQLLTFVEKCSPIGVSVPDDLCLPWLPHRDKAAGGATGERVSSQPGPLCGDQHIWGIGVGEDGRVVSWGEVWPLGRRGVGQVSSASAAQWRHVDSSCEPRGVYVS